MWSNFSMKETTVQFTEAKTHLSEYARRAEAGHATLVLKHRRAAFLIAPPPQATRSRPKKPGLAGGRIRMARDFDKTPEGVIQAFEGSQ